MKTITEHLKNNIAESYAVNEVKYNGFSLYADDKALETIEKLNPRFDNWVDFIESITKNVFSKVKNEIDSNNLVVEYGYGGLSSEINMLLIKFRKNKEVRFEIAIVYEAPDIIKDIHQHENTSYYGVAKRNNFEGKCFKMCRLLKDYFKNL